MSAPDWQVDNEKDLQRGLGGREAHWFVHPFGIETLAEFLRLSQQRRRKSGEAPADEERMACQTGTLKHGLARHECASFFDAVYGGRSLVLAAIARASGGAIEIVNAPRIPPRAIEG